MPISVKRDIKKAWGLGNHFFLGDTPSLTHIVGKKGPDELVIDEYFRKTKGTYLKFVKPVIADQNWNEFYSSWDIFNPNRDIAKSTSSKFNLRPKDEDTFDELWPLLADSLNYANDNAVEDSISKDIHEAYGLVAKIAAGKEIIEDKPTFNRPIERDDPSFVIFSDLHLTAYNDADKPDFFDKFNYDLYKDVLKTYYATHGFCLVENGDVEECVISQFTLEEAQNRKNTSHGKSQFPITNSNEKWDAFLAIRYEKREDNLEDIIEKYQDYYDILRDEFINKGKYVKITGNHDTYMNGKHEAELKEIIETELNKKLNDSDDKKISVADVLTIKRNGAIKYVVLHGHQFDTQSVQHGDIPYAKSIGEVNSECAAWCNEGADRAWELDDTKRWYIGNTPEDHTIETKGNFRNVLAHEEPLDYKHGTKGGLLGGGTFDLLAANTGEIKDDPKGFVETVLGHEIAWEYFENSDNGFNAFALEYLTGDEGIKFRHMNEIELCEKYKTEFLKEAGIPEGSNIYDIPKLILGHTHEPRQNAVKYLPINPSNPPTTVNDLISAPYYWYLNSGSAGRFENLIWCVEIFGNIDKICSWSKVDGKLKKIVWKSEGDKLIHDTDIGYQIFDIL